MNRIGERIRKRREYLELSMNNLAKGVGVTSSLLSQIENGKAFPSLHTLKHIADFLNTSVGTLIGENDTFAQDPVINWEDKKFVKKNDHGASLYLLAHYSPVQSMEAYMIDLEPGGSSIDLLDNKRHGQEFCFVIEGSVTAVLSSKTYELDWRASIYFYSNDLKYYRNQTSSKASLLWVVSPLRT